MFISVNGLCQQYAYDCIAQINAINSTEIGQITFIYVTEFTAKFDAESAIVGLIYRLSPPLYRQIAKIQIHFDAVLKKHGHQH